MQRSHPAVQPADEVAHNAPRSVADLDFRPRGAVNPSPTDWRDVVLYQVVLDRFDDGSDNPPVGRDTPHERDDDAGWKWQGGTLKGLERRLDYVAGLGVGGIWLSCPLKQRAGEHTYHGYAIQDFLQIDPRFGTTGDLRDLVDACHARGLVIVLDVVIDHTGDLFHYEGDGGAIYDGGRTFNFNAWNDGGGRPPEEFGPDDAVWPRELQAVESFVRKGEMGNVMNVGAAEAKDGDFMSLKKLDLLRPETLGAIVACYKHWIAVADVDGFRIDALRHVHHEAASDFVHAIREYAESIGKANFLQVGEVADGDDEMRRYVGNNVELRHGGAADPATDPSGRGDYPQLDAVIDFELHRRLIPVLLGERPVADVADLWQRRKDYYRDYGRSGRYYLSYLENHDEGARDHHRLLSGTFEQTPDGYDRPGGDPRLAIMATAVLLCGMGIPCLYYGTEQGLDGGGEKDDFLREAMFGGEFGPFGTRGHAAFDPKHPIYSLIATICDARRNEPALRYGRQYARPISGDGVHFGLPEYAGVFAFARVLDVTEIVVVANPTLEAVSTHVGVDGALNPPGGQMRNLLDHDWRVDIAQTDEGQAFVPLDLPPRGVAVLRLSVD